MKILALEFSSAQRSVAVLNDRTVAIQVETSTGAFHPMTMIEEALREAALEREQIDCLAVGLGPGSYTGIRAAIAIAQGWQLARGTKLLGVSSADTIAAQAYTDGLRGDASVVIDAQRDEVYLGDYQITSEGWRNLSPLRLATLDEARQRETAGSALLGPETTRWFPQGRLVFPVASIVCHLASNRTDFIPGERLEPIYLRETNFVKAPPPRVLPA